MDNKSEKVVQEALDRAAQGGSSLLGIFSVFLIDSGRTTIIIAHRLSTIRHADRIIVMEKGAILEQGDHQTLMDLQGTYFHLVEQQNLHQIGDTEEPITMMLPEKSKDSSIGLEYRKQSDLDRPALTLSQIHDEKSNEVDQEFLQMKVMD